MAECNTCGGYLSIEDKIRLSMKCDANGNVVWQGALLNQNLTGGKLILTFDETSNTLYNAALPILQSKGVKATFYINTDNVGLANMVTWSNLLAMHNAGQDIQCHSKTHANLTTLTIDQVEAEMAAVNAAFIANGLPAPKHHAYPGGDYNENTKSAISTLRQTGRGTDSTYYPIMPTADKLSLNAISIDNCDTAKLIAVKAYMDQAKAANGALILYGHGVTELGAQYSIPAQMFEDIIDYAQANNIEIITMKQFYTALVPTYTAHETIDLTIASTGTGAGVATLKLQAKEDCEFVLTGNARFYTDLAATQGESTRYWMRRGVGVGGVNTIYVKCTSGTSTMSVAKNELIRIVEWTASTNAPSIGGSVAELTELLTFTVAGNNTLSGSLTNLTKLTYLYVSGSNTLSGSFAGATGLTYVLLSGSNTVNSSIDALTRLTELTVTGYNTISGDITNLTSLTFLNVAGNNTLSGDISGLIWLKFVIVSGTPIISGNIANITGLQYFSVDSANLTFTTVVALTALSNLVVSGKITLTSTQVNQILADFWANRDAAKPRADRNINLNGKIGSQGPTGQGVIDKAALQAYRSPNNDPEKAFWTVLTR